MADIKFKYLAKQILCCHRQSIRLHILQAQSRINGQVKKNKMSTEVKLFERLGQLVLETSPFHV